ncbi:GNAT family N-acetyltransferase [Streptomyces cinereoruber]|uniref:GNAT family N-acetyltransferase n=1 Tax=Streptomyces cinereoruber TaxID=67260 RepID=UPI001E39B579|nr:GNAT family N-acetyltransferase [Streptomyces cinereoruber]
MSGLDLALVREASVDPYIPLVTTVPSPYSEAGGRAFVERRWGEGDDRGRVPLRPRDAGGRPVGTVGLWPGAEGVALGYWVVASARGGGAAATGLAAVADRALRGLGLPRLVCTSSRGTPPPCASPSAWVSGAKGCGRGGCGSGASAGTCSCSRSRTATGARRHAPGARHPALRGRPGMTGRPGCTRVISTSR